jgi:hypothetical protein
MGRKRRDQRLCTRVAFIGGWQVIAAILPPPARSFSAGDEACRMMGSYYSPWGKGIRDSSVQVQCSQFQPTSAFGKSKTPSDEGRFDLDLPSSSTA